MAVNYLDSSSFIFHEAVEFLRGKRALTKEDYDLLNDESRVTAFTVSGYSEAEVLNTFLETLTQACQEGTTKEQFLENMNTFLEKNGYTALNPWKSQVIFRTNMQTAMNAGHFKSMTEPMTMKLRPYWQYKTAGDGKVRAEHEAMHDRIYMADDPIWDIWYPPNGFACRCTVVSLSRKQFERQTNPLETKPPIKIDKGTGEIGFASPDKGFSNNPAKQKWKPDASALRPDVGAAYKEAKKEAAQTEPEE